MLTSTTTIVLCAITGAVHTPTMSDALPITADDIVDQGLAAAEAAPPYCICMCVTPAPASPRPIVAALDPPASDMPAHLGGLARKPSEQSMSNRSQTGRRIPQMLGRRRQSS